MEYVIKSLAVTQSDTTSTYMNMFWVLFFLNYQMWNAMWNLTLQKEGVTWIGSLSVTRTIITKQKQQMNYKAHIKLCPKKCEFRFIYYIFGWMWTNNVLKRQNKIGLQLTKYGNGSIIVFRVNENWFGQFFSPLPELNDKYFIWQNWRSQCIHWQSFIECDWLRSSICNWQAQKFCTLF